MIVDQIRQDIILGRLRLGQQIPEMQYADEHQVSRTPVREAILALAAEGLIVIRPQSGSRVIRFDVDTLTNLFQVRLIYEVGAARQASERALLQLVPDMQALFERMDRPVEAPEDYLLFNDIDTQFHTRIVEAAENPLLLERYASISDKSLAARMRLDKTQLNSDRANIHHGRIIDALEIRDFDALEATLTEHFAWVQNLALASPELQT